MPAGIDPAQLVTAAQTMTSQSPDAPPRASSPSASFYAMSDDEEGEYETITHVQSGRGVKLLFSKSKVCLHLLLHHRCLLSIYALRSQNPSTTNMVH